MKYILEGKMMIEENVLGDYFSSDTSLWDIAEEAEECYRDKDINLTGAFIEDQTTGEIVGGKDY